MLLDQSLTAAVDTSIWRDVATDTEVWARLGTAIGTDRLPGPSMIEVNLDTWAATIWLQRHDDTDLHTWIAWLGAGETTTHLPDSPGQPGCTMRDVTAEARWRSWTFKVRLLQALPIGQTGGALLKQRIEVHRAAGHPGGVGGCKACPTPARAVTR